MPCRSSRTRTSTNPAAPHDRLRRRRLPGANLHRPASRPPRSTASHVRARSPAPRRGRRRRQTAPPPARAAAPRAASVGAIGARGRTADSTPPDRTGRARRRCRRRGRQATRAATPCRSAFVRAQPRRRPRRRWPSTVASRPLERQRHRQAAAAGADVEHARGHASASAARPSSTSSSVSGPRDEHAGADRELAAVELLHAADVGHRLAGRAAAGQRRERRRRPGRRRLVPAGQPGRAIPGEHVAQQQLGVERWLRRRGCPAAASRPAAAAARSRRRIAAGYFVAAGSRRAAVARSPA